MRACLVAVLVALSAYCCAPLLARTGQEVDRAAAERSLERFQAYLAQKPFHGPGFERFVAAAVELNALGRVVAELEAKVAAGERPRAVTPEAAEPGTEREPEDTAEPTLAPATEAERVLLARLYARTDRTADALAILDALGGSPGAGSEPGDGRDDDPARRAFRLALSGLRGELLVAAGELGRGLAELDAAASAMSEDTRAPTDPRALEALHTLRAEAALRLGDRARAAGALADLARVDPASFDLALDVAERLARANLLDEATERYAAALALAGDDTPRRCRALAAFGELHERRGAPAEALATYAEAFDLLGRGHWLKRQLELRIVAVHTREGSLSTLAGELRAALETSPADLDRRSLLARVEVALRDLPAARATLEAACRDFPQDLALGRELLDVLALAEDDDARVAELQRLVGAHPEELELYIELGQVLASSGRLEQARREWRRTLERRLQDPGLCLRLAGLHARSGLVDEALELVERALALEPAELGHYDELARLLRGAGRHGDVEAALARAEAAAGDDPVQLETLATIAAAHRDEARVGRALQRALAAAPDEPRLTRALAEHARRTGDTARAAGLLRGLVAAADAETARDAAQRLLRLRRAELHQLQREEEARLAAAPDDRAALYIGALVAEARRQYPEALALLERLLAVEPGAEHAAVLAAELHVRLGDDEAAVACYHALIELQPRQRGRWLGELGRLYVRLDDEERAIECFEECLRLAPDNPATFREVARAYEALGERARARECLRQVLRLRPDDAHSRLALADLLLAAPVEDEPRGKEQAEELARSVARGADAELAERGREWLFERLDERGEVAVTIARLRAELAQNPFDTDRPLELLDLFVREDEYELALELLDELLAYRPSDAALLRERAQLHASLQRHDAALADYATLQRLPDVDRDEVLLCIGECHIEAGDLARADEALAQVGDRMAVHALYRRQKLLDRALEVLQAELERTPEDLALLERLVALQQDRGALPEALAAFDRASALTDATPARLGRRAQLLRAAGDREAYSAALVEALLAIEPPIGPAGDAAVTLSRGARRALRDETQRVRREMNDLQRQLASDGGSELWTELVHRAAVAAPLREELVGAAFSALAGAERFDEAAALVERSRAELAAGRCPVGQSKERWKRLLDSRDKRLVRADPVRAAARAEQLAAALETDVESLTAERIRELAALYVQDGDDDARLALYEVAAARFPDDRRYAAAVAALHIERGDDTSALPLLQALVAGGGLPAGADPLRANRKDRERLEARLPAALVPLVTDELVARQRRLEARPGFDGHWAVAARPYRADVEVALARCLAAAGERDAARALLAGLEPTHPEHTSRACFVAALYTELGFEDDAERLERAALGALESASSEPVLRAGVSFKAEARALMMGHARELIAAGEVARGFELARRWGGREVASEALRALADHGPLRAELEARWDAARAAPGVEDMGSMLDRGVLLLDVLVHTGDWTAAGVVADELAALVPTSAPFALLAFELDRRRGDDASARARLEGAIAAALDEVRRTGVVPPAATQPDDFDRELSLPEPIFGLLPPSLEPSASATRELFTQSAWMLGLTTRTAPDQWVPWDLEAGLCELDWVEQRWADVAARLDRLFTATSSGGNWTLHLLAQAARDVPVDVASLPLWELLYELDGNDPGNVARYGTALEAAGRTDDALRAYRKFARANQGDSSTEEIEQRIARLDPASVAATALPEDLTAAVAADPKNVALRRALVHELLGERRYDDAAEHALALERLAPHLDDVLVLCEDTLLLARRDAQYVERVQRRLPSLQDGDERILRSVRAATLLCDMGDRAGAEELLRVGFATADPGSGFTTAGFWWRRGDAEAAIAALEATRAEVVQQFPWLASEIDPYIARLKGASAPTFVLDPARLEAFWREQGPGTRVTVQGLHELGEVTGLDAAELEARPNPEAAAALEAHAATLSGARATVMSALAHFARGDREGFEERLLELGTAPRAERAFARAAVDSARKRGAFARAAALLQRFALAAPPRARREVATSIGSIPERAALEIELGALELAAATSAATSAATPGAAGAEGAAVEGRNSAPEAVRAAVLARWRAALADHPAPLLHLTHAAGFEDAAREALAAIEAKRAAARTPGPLSERVLLVATALSRAPNDLGGAHARLMESERLRPAGPRDVRMALLVEVARECGELAEVKDLVLRRQQQEREDVGWAVLALRLVAEVDGPRAALALARDWPAGDHTWHGLWSRLASRAREMASTPRRDTRSPDGARSSDVPQANDDAGSRELRALERSFLERARECSPGDFEWHEGRWRLAELMLDAGEHEAVRRSFADLDTENEAYVRATAARHLHRAGHSELALELLAPLAGAERAIGLELDILLDLGRVDEAHQRLVDCVASELVHAFDAIDAAARAKLRAAPRHAEELSGARVELQAVVGDGARGRVLSKLVTLERIELEDASARLATLEALARERPGDPRVLAWLVEDWLEVGRYDTALAALEEQLESDDRLNATSLAPEQRSNRVGELRRQRARALLGLAQAAPGPGVDPDERQRVFLDALSDRKGRRFAFDDRWSHTVYNLDRLLQLEDEGAMLAWRHGFPVEAHRRFWKDTPPDPAGSLSWSTSLRAALLAGDVELALDRCLDALRDGAPAAVDACAPVFGRVERLADLEQRLAAWVREASRDLAADPAAVDDVLERAASVRRAIAEQRGDMPALVALARERVSRRDWDPGAHELLAESLLRAGDFAAGLDAANHAASLRERAVLDITAPELDAALARSGPASWQDGGPVRFGAEAFEEESEEVLGVGGGSFGTVTATIAWTEFADDEPADSAATAGPDLRAELCFLTGRRDEALAHEARRIDRSTARGDGGEGRARLRVAADYARYGVAALDREAERLLLAAVESGPEGALALERLAELAQRRGDLETAQQRRAEATARRPAHLRRIDQAADARSRGLLALDAGDCAGALALLAEAEAHERRTGTWDGLGAAHAHGLAQARAAVLGVEAARTELTAALAEHPRHERAARTRALLQGH